MAFAARGPLLAVAALSVFAIVFLTGTAYAYTGSANVDRNYISNENCGGTAEVKVTVSNGGLAGALCWYKLDSQTEWTKVTPACMSNGASTTFTVDVPMEILAAPTQNRVISVECRDYWNLLWNTCESTGTYYESTQFSTESWTFPISTDCTGYLSTQNFIADAQTFVTDAESSIAKAKGKLAEARELGLKNVSIPEGVLNDAEASLEIAETQIKQANQWFSTNLLDESKSLAGQSKSSAIASRELAETSFHQTSLLIQEFKKKMNEAQISLRDADTSIKRADVMLDNAREALANVTKIDEYIEIVAELEIIQPKVNISDSQAKLDQSRTLINDANFAFEQKDFDHAINISIESKRFADDSYDIAFTAYSPINTIILTLGEVGKVVVFAADEINRTDTILTRSAFVVRSMKKWDVNVTDVEQIIFEGQAAIDEAKDKLTIARNRVQLGIASEAIQLAVEAKDLASLPANRLERVKSTFLLRVQDTLEEELKSANRNIRTAEIEIDQASNTYMAAQEKIFDAQDNLDEAKAALADGLRYSDEVLDSQDVEVLTEKASAAFAALEKANLKAEESIQDSKDAKSGLVNTTAAAGAVVAGSLGGGLLLYRRKSKAESKDLGETNQTSG